MRILTDNLLQNCALILISFLVFPLSVLAGGSFSFKEHLKPLLLQQPELEKYLLQSLDFSDSGFANRIGQNVNPRFGGRRIGPYILQAKPKGRKGDFIFEVTVETEYIMKDAKGKLTEDISQAYDIQEKLISVEIKPLTLR